MRGHVGQSRRAYRFLCPEGIRYYGGVCMKSGWEKHEIKDISEMQSRLHGTLVTQSLPGYSDEEAVSGERKYEEDRKFRG